LVELARVAVSAISYFIVSTSYHITRNVSAVMSIQRLKDSLDVARRGSGEGERERENHAGGQAVGRSSSSSSRRGSNFSKDQIAKKLEKLQTLSRHDKELIEDLQDKVDRQTAELKEVRRAASEAQGVVGQAVESKRTMDEHYAQMQAMYGSSVEQNQFMLKQVAALKAQIEEHKHVKVAAEREGKEAGATTAALRAEVHELTQKLKDMTSERVVEVGALRKSVEEHENAARAAETARESAALAMEQRDSSVAAASDSLSKANGIIQRLQGEKAKILKELSALQTSEMQNKQQLARASHSNSVAEKKMRELTDAAKREKQARVVAERKFKELTVAAGKQRKNNEADLQQLKQIVQTSTRSNQQLVGQMSQLRKQFDLVCVERTEIQAEVQSTAKSHDARTEALAEQKTLFAAQSSELEKAISHAKALQEQLTDTQSQLHTQEQSIQDAVANKAMLDHMQAVSHDVSGVVQQLTKSAKAQEASFTCSKCIELLNNPLTLIPCGHSFCATCVDIKEDAKGNAVDLVCECGVPATFLLENEMLQSLASKLVYSRQSLEKITSRLSASSLAM
jgi:chromosome segregation ATPase